MDPLIGEMIWSKGQGEFGDNAIGGMVVDSGITDKGERYVIALVGSPTYPNTSHKKRQWLYGRVEGATMAVDHGQVAELRRFFLTDLAPTDGFRDATKIAGFMSKTLLAAGLSRSPNDVEELGAAHAALGEALIDLRAEQVARDERAALQGVVESGKRAS